MPWRSDKSLGARLLLYWVIILGPMAIANFAMNHRDSSIAAIGAAITLALGIGSLWMISVVERSNRPRKLWRRVRVCSTYATDSDSER